MDTIENKIDTALPVVEAPTTAPTDEAEVVGFIAETTDEVAVDPTTIPA
jgi:hypothetical protein